MAVFFFNQTVSLKHMETHVMTHKVTRIRIINIENAFSCDPLFDTSAHKGGEGAPMCFFPTSSLHTSHRLPLPNWTGGEGHTHWHSWTLLRMVWRWKVNIWPCPRGQREKQEKIRGCLTDVTTKLSTGGKTHFGNERWSFKVFESVDIIFSFNSKTLRVQKSGGEIWPHLMRNAKCFSKVLSK